MPVNVRNWWIEGQVDGKASPIMGGPKGRDGGFSLKVLQRDEGDIRPALALYGYADNDGNLTLVVSDGEGALIHKIETVRSRPKIKKEVAGNV